jgi:predicted nucleic acid-binding protein
MKVVLDSNIIIADFNLQSPGFKILFENSRNGQIDLYIPEIVLDEVFNKFNHRLRENQQAINSELKKFNKVSSAEVESPILNDLIDESSKRYRIKVEEVIKDNKITIIPYPVTDHRYLAKKAMLTKKPFNANEKGYRDCLIWENIKSLISKEKVELPSSPELVYLTNNYKDFASKDNELHEDLIDELEEERLHTDSINIYASLGEFNDKVTKLYLNQADQFRDRLKQDEFEDFNLKLVIDNFLFEEFDGSELTNYQGYAPYANDNPTVDGFNDDYEIKDVSVRKLSFDEYVVDVEFDLDTELDFFVDKSDYWSSEDTEFNVIDLDWNDHVVHVSNSAILPISMTLIINSKLECLSIEISKIDEKYE